MPRKPSTCPDCGSSITGGANRCSPCDANRRSRALTDGLPDPNPSGLCMCGCGASTAIAKVTSRRIGHVRGHHVRFILGHSRMRQWDDCIEVDSETGCHLWRCGRNGAGYAQYGTDASVHRTIWEKRFGPIAKGAHLHHRCETKRCVNPDHLEPLSAGDHHRLHAKQQATRRSRDTRQGATSVTVPPSDRKTSPSSKTQ